jgi:WD40 repeat protein
MEHAVKLWDTATGNLLLARGDARSMTTRPSSALYSRDGARIAAGSREFLKFWDTPSGVRFFAGDHSRLAYSPDGTRLLAGGQSSIKLLDAATGEVLRAFAGHSGDVTTVAFSADGKRVLAGIGFDGKPEATTDQGKIKVWDAASGKLLLTLRGHGKGVNAAAFTPDGSRIVSGGIWDVAPNAATGFGKLRFWNAETGELIRTIDAHHEAIEALAISPDGTRVATGSSLDPVSFGRLYQIETIRLWDAATGTLIRTFGGPTVPVQALAFSPDGGRLLSGSDDNLVRLWDAASGKLIRTFDGHSGAVTTVAFSADGTRVVSGSADGTLRIWAADTGELLATLMSEEKKWLVIVPEGFFATSAPVDAQSLSVVRGLDAYDVSQMFQALYAPDLVREKLAGDPDGEVRNAARALDLEAVIESGAPPSVALLSPAAGASADEVITAEATITQQAGGIGRIEWRVNGVTVAVRSAPGTDRTRTVRQALALEPGENVIEVVAYNGRNLLSTLPARTTVTWNAPPVQPRPRLFVISVGINAYRDTLLRPLRQAVADAKAFGVAMKAAGEGLYSDVDVTYLLDAEATADGLVQAIDAVGARMHPRDVFIFFAAAHGKSENGRYHLFPQNFSSDAPGTIAEKSIGQDRLQDWFANRIKARRGLILLDTCESGALVASRPSGLDLASSEEALGRLNEATGRPVLTAAAANQVALEGYRGHGVFTYAILDALQNGDINNNGQIELSEVVAHIQKLAPRLSRELAGGRAFPTAPEAPRSASAQLGSAVLAPRLADRGLRRELDEPGSGYSQKPRLGSRGEDFPLVKRLPALPPEKL